MKKRYTLLFILFAVTVANAQIINFPDANFKQRLLSINQSSQEASNQAGEHIAVDANGDGEIQESEASLVWKLNLQIINLTITDLTGINYFSNLRELTITGHNIPSLDLTSLTHLEGLQCSNNHLTSLNVSGLSNLSWFGCNTNQLTSINISNMPLLFDFSCFGNQITALDLSNKPLLRDLSCGYNPITALDISNLTALKNFDCESSQISTLDVSNLVNLEQLSCGLNQITALNITDLVNLQGLRCGSNQISTLDFSNSVNLAYLDCDHNLLTNLDLNHCPYLWHVDCSFNNFLTSVFMKAGLEQPPLYFEFTSNPLLRYMCVDENVVESVQFIIDALSLNINVNTYCSFIPGGTYYTIEGTQKFDTNADGCDTGDSTIPNFHLVIDDGVTSGTIFSNNAGGYSIMAPEGSYTLTPFLENPSYYNITPQTITVMLPEPINPYVQDFCVTSNGAHDDLAVVLIPLTSARPGFDSAYKIIYKNSGTTTQSGSVSLNFDDTVLDFVTATAGVASQVTNILTWDFINLKPFESREIRVVFNINSPVETPAVNDGDILDYTASVAGAADETFENNSFRMRQPVVNSLDPNDKTCLEGDSAAPDRMGDYFHYMVRFENTGSANAENIVVKDVIDTDKFDVTSLVPLYGSHSFRTVVNGNKVEFIFENINLPFDDANNDGYVTFKIKTKPTLVVGDTFSNSANIYFDYNFPIVTNTATTIVQALANPDFDFNSFFSLSPVPTKNNLTISVKQSIIIKSISIFNALGQLVQVNVNPNENVDVSDLKTGSYFIRITTDRGIANSKFIKQ